MSKFKKAVKKVLPIGLDAKVSDISQKLDELNSRVEAIKGEFSSHDFRIDELKEKVKQVEPYQPIYGISGIIENPSRDTRDRAEAIYAYYNGNIAGLRVLDIGSSLGYLCFYLADRGAFVNGWDLSEKNVEVSRLTSEINGLRVNYYTKTLDLDTVETIENNEYDAIILLNVFHHITHYRGLEHSQKLVASLLDKTPLLILELARKGEDKNIFWDKAQPDDELDILGDLREKVDITKVSEFHNHLSNNSRPMYAIKKKCTIRVNNREYIYEKSSSEAYPFSSATQLNERRKYYWCSDLLVKEYFFEHGRTGVNAQLVINEIATLLKTKTVYKSPQIVDYEVNQKGAKVVFKLIDGTLASDINKYSDKDMSTIIIDILRSLADLRKLNLYHNDVRSWNILYNKKNASLIDYGQVSANNFDNDLVALLWVVDALHNGGRESTEIGKTSLPAEDKLPSIGKNLRQLIKSGIIDPAIILTQLTKNK